MTTRRPQLAHDLGAVWWGVAFLGLGLQLPVVVISRRGAALSAVVASVPAVALWAQKAQPWCALAAAIAGVPVEQMVHAWQVDAAATKRGRVVRLRPDGRAGERDGQGAAHQTGVPPRSTWSSTVRMIVLGVPRVAVGPSAKARTTFACIAESWPGCSEMVSVTIS